MLFCWSNYYNQLTQRKSFYLHFTNHISFFFDFCQITFIFKPLLQILHLKLNLPISQKIIKSIMFLTLIRIITILIKIQISFVETKIFLLFFSMILLERSQSLLYLRFLEKNQKEKKEATPILSFIFLEKLSFQKLQIFSFVIESWENFIISLDRLLVIKKNFCFLLQ